MGTIDAATAGSSEWKRNTGLNSDHEKGFLGVLAAYSAALQWGEKSSLILILYLKSDKLSCGYLLQCSTVGLN